MDTACCCHVPVIRIEDYEYGAHVKTPDFHLAPIEALKSTLVYPHRHDFYHVMWVIAGSGSHVIDSVRYEVRPHTLYFMTPGQIHEKAPHWLIFRDGCPGGESPKQAATRADRVVSRVRAVQGDVLLFSSGHFIRVLAARWIGIESAANARSFMLSTASLSALGYEHDFSRPVIRLWNDTQHVIS